jgi:SAM-dependent methyltransferase
MPHYFIGQRVLEVGARDVNGSARVMFECCVVIGVDMLPGKYVDHVGALITLDCFEPASFGVVFSTEALEHDPDWDKTLWRMWELLKPGGLFFFTAGTTGRPEHGTTRSDNAFGGGEQPDYYRNITEGDIRGLGLPLIEPQFLFNETHHDIYLRGIKP